MCQIQGVWHSYWRRILVRQISRISSANRESSGQDRDKTIAPTAWAMVSIIMARTCFFTFSSISSLFAKTASCLSIPSANTALIDSGWRAASPHNAAIVQPFPGVSRCCRDRYWFTNATTSISAVFAADCANPSAAASAIKSALDRKCL